MEKYIQFDINLQDTHTYPLNFASHSNTVNPVCAHSTVSYTNVSFMVPHQMVLALHRFNYSCNQTDVYIAN